MKIKHNYDTRTKQLSNKIKIYNVNDADRYEEKWDRKNSTLSSKVPDGSRSTPVDLGSIAACPLE